MTNRERYLKEKEEERKRMEKLDEQSEALSNDPIWQRIAGVVTNPTRPKSRFEEEMEKLMTTPNLPDDILMIRASQYPSIVKLNQPPEKEYDVEFGGGEGTRIGKFWPTFKANYDERGRLIQDIPEGDPSLAIRSAAITGKNRQERNLEAVEDRALSDLGKIQIALSPEAHERRLRNAPAGGRAGLANLNRPQYLAARNESIQAPKTLARENIEGASANSKEAQYDKVMRGLGFEKNDSNEYEFKNNASAAKREALQKSVDDYDKQIKALEEEIALSEAGDPLYDLAVMRLIMDDDNTLMSDIRGKIAKRIEREFQMKQKKADQEFQHNENELNRENTLEAAKMNKEEQEKAKVKDAEDSYEGALMLYNWAKEDLEANKDPSNKTELQRSLQKAEDTLRTAARKANKLDDYRKIVGTSDAERDRKVKMAELFLKSKGITGGLKGFKRYYDESLKTPEARQTFLNEANEFELDASDFDMPGEEAIQDAAVKAGKKFTNEQTNFKKTIENKTYGTPAAGGKYVFTSKDKQAIADDKAKAKSLGLTMTDPDPANGKATISK